MTADKLSQLKKDYAKLQKKYKLPDFAKLNLEFEIERLAGKNTEFLLRGVRRSIERKAGDFLKMLEEFVNPGFASIASLTLLKSFGDKEKKLIKDGYQSLVGLIIKSAILETDYDEKKEAEFIKEALKIWEAAKKELNELMKSAEQVWQKKIEEKKVDYKYFG